MTANEVLRKVRELKRPQRRELLRKLLTSEEFAELSEDIEDILTEIARRGEPVEPAERVFRRLDKSRRRA